MSALDPGGRRDPSDANDDRRGGCDHTEGRPRAAFLVHEGAPRRAQVPAADDLLRQLELEHIRRTVRLGSGAFWRAEAWSPPMTASLGEAAELVEARALSLASEHPELAGPDLLEIAEDAAFLAAVAGLHREARTAGRSRSAAEVIADQVAESLLAAGVRYQAPYRSWTISGSRDHQTYMSVTPAMGTWTGPCARRRPSSRAPLSRP